MISIRSAEVSLFSGLSSSVWLVSLFSGSELELSLIPCSTSLLLKKVLRISWKSIFPKTWLSISLARAILISVSQLSNSKTSTLYTSVPSPTKTLTLLLVRWLFLKQPLLVSPSLSFTCPPFTTILCLFLHITMPQILFTNLYLLSVLFTTTMLNSPPLHSSLIIRLKLRRRICLTALMIGVRKSMDLSTTWRTMPKSTSRRFFSTTFRVVILMLMFLFNTRSDLSIESSPSTIRRKMSFKLTLPQLMILSKMVLTHRLLLWPKKLSQVNTAAERKISFLIENTLFKINFLTIM